MVCMKTKGKDNICMSRQKGQIISGFEPKIQYRSKFKNLKTL